jgi:hypothetical protein
VTSLHVPTPVVTGPHRSVLARTAFLPCLAVLAAQALDVVTTTIGMGIPAMGGEANPFMAGAMSAYGVLPALLVSKVVLTALFLLGLAGIERLGAHRLTWALVAFAFIPGVLNTVGLAR